MTKSSYKTMLLPGKYDAYAKCAAGCFSMGEIDVAGGGAPMAEGLDARPGQDADRAERIGAVGPGGAPAVAVGGGAAAAPPVGGAAAAPAVGGVTAEAGGGAAAKAGGARPAAVTLLPRSSA